MSKKRHVLPVLVGIGATALGGCDEKPRAPETEGPQEQPTTSNTTPKPKPTIIIRDGDPIRPRLVGVLRRAPSRPAPPPAPQAARQVRSATKGSKGAAKGRAAVAAEAATTSTADPRVAVAIVHDHPPGQPCAPLTQQEVKKALDDLRSTKQ